jgi:predicted regulator of Ras-like GTPase activity (Roadblock/LC7/MglB family)
MEQGMRATAELAWLIDDLVSRTPAAERAVVLSADGLLLASSTSVPRAEAEQLSAVAASLFGLSRGAAKRFGKGSVRQAVVEMSGGYLFVAAGGVGACVALIADADADVGLIAYEIAMLVTRVGEYLSAPARTPTPARVE